jgi:TorA maturation chaperone TorD
LLLPIAYEYTKVFQQHERDKVFPWKALYSFPQSIQWARATTTVCV